MPITLSIATVIDLGGKDHLPAEFLGMVASAEDALYPPEPTVPDGVEVAPQEPDYGPLGPLADWLIEHDETELAAACKYILKTKVRPQKEPRSRGTEFSWWSWPDSPKYLSLRYTHKDSFLECLALYACELQKVRAEMAL